MVPFKMKGFTPFHLEETEEKEEKVVTYKEAQVAGDRNKELLSKSEDELTDAERAEMEELRKTIGAFNRKFWKKELE